MQVWQDVINQADEYHGICIVSINRSTLGAIPQNTLNMKIKNVFYVLLLLLCAISCKQNTAKVDITRANPWITPSLIQICVDSILVLDSAINTRTYYLDFEGLKEAYPTLATSYLNKHSKVKLTNFDSLIKVKDSWLNIDFKNNDIIQFKRILESSDSTILIKAIKRRYIDASFGAEIVFKKERDRLVCIKNKITWIN